jgi:enoyl-CoA hydratase
MTNVLYRSDDGIATITINRPEVRNAVDGPTAQLLQDALSQADTDEAINVVILTGSGGTFCAGADLSAISDGRGNTVTELEADTILGSLGPMGPTRRAMTKPVIAAVEGHAVAGGLELALWCDLRVAAQDATFGVYCRRWGVPLIDGGTVRLPRLIGHSHAMDLILTGRPVGGDEALQMGLANRLTSPGSAVAGATELARTIAAFPQRCVRSDRRSAIEQWGQTESEALANEVVLGMTTIRSGETREGASRFASGEGRHGAF